MSAILALSTLGILALGAGCGGSVHSNRLANGAYRVTCTKGMSDCVARAEKLCSEGYVILEGQNQVKLLGGSTSSYRKATQMGELTIECGELMEGSGQSQTVALPTFGKKSEEPVPLNPGGGAAPTASACVPGETKACVGPGACQGGQVCLPAGTGYGVCDCGLPESVVPPAPSAPPAAQPPAAQPPAAQPPAAQPPAGSLPGGTAPKGPKPGEPVPGAAPAPTPL